jgi:iron complex transport system permease protein
MSATISAPLAGSARRPAAFLAMALLALAAALVVVGLGVGSRGFEAMWGARSDPVAWQILWDIRLPRTLGAWLAGALLGLAGAIAQGLFRNPLADPYLLGSASGAALGLAIVLALLGASPFASEWVLRLGFTGAAFAGAVAGVLLTLMLAQGVQHTMRLLLAGVIVGVVLGAVRDLVTLAAPETLQGLQAFMLGSTGYVGWGACAVMLAVFAPGLAVAWALGRGLDALALGESTAASLGLPLGAMRTALVAVLALATGAAVAQTGLIAFVGLASPHLVRSAARTTHGVLVFLSALMGGVLLLAADVLARWLVAPQELPVGVLTAVLGGSYLLWLMYRRSGIARRAP